jgi:hypothetical protein
MRPLLTNSTLLQQPGFIRSLLILAISTVLMVCGSEGACAEILPPFNAQVLRAIARMPEGGQYAVNRAAADALARALRPQDGTLSFHPEQAQPSFCSGATYLVFVMAAEPYLQPVTDSRSGNSSLTQFLISGQGDGVGIWGRWNANGPGTAKLFKDAGLGRSFWNFEEPAFPGDFLKLWWKEAIGRDEYGHSVIFLNYEIGPDGEKGIRIWSSNKPLGYGEKFIPFTKIHHALFSRCEHPERLPQCASLLPRDSFLADMLRKNFSLREVKSVLTNPASPRPTP